MSRGEGMTEKGGERKRDMPVAAARNDLRGINKTVRITANSLAVRHPRSHVSCTQLLSIDARRSSRTPGLPTKNPARSTSGGPRPEISLQTAFHLWQTSLTDLPGPQHSSLRQIAFHAIEAIQAIKAI